MHAIHMSTAMEGWLLAIFSLYFMDDSIINGFLNF
jgi:hypothetical protein